MAILPIVHAPDPRLKVVSAPVAAVDDGVRRLMDDMLETMYAEPGVGLSAVQVGVPKRVVVIDTGEGQGPLCMANPQIARFSSQTVLLDEGCLSLPDQFAHIERPAEVQLRYLDRNGRERRLAADGVLARCIQHELDHLEGVLFVDRLSALRRGIVMRRLAKLKRARLRESA